MTDAVKLLTEAEWRSHYKALGASSGSIETAIAMLRERGLILPDPVDPLMIEAREIVIATTPQPQRNFNIRKAEIRRGWKDDGFCVQIALAALKRGMEMRPPLTREMVKRAVQQTISSIPGGGYSYNLDELHDALTKEQS